LVIIMLPADLVLLPGAVQAAAEVRRTSRHNRSRLPR